MWLYCRNRSNVTNHKILLTSHEIFGKIINQTKTSHNVWFGLQLGPNSSYWTTQPDDCTFLSQVLVFLQQPVAGWMGASKFSFWEWSPETCISKEIINLLKLSFRKKNKLQNNPILPVYWHIYQPKDKDSDSPLMMVLSQEPTTLENCFQKLCEVAWKRKYLLCNLLVNIWLWITATHNRMSDHVF